MQPVRSRRRCQHRSAGAGGCRARLGVCDSPGLQRQIAGLFVVEERGTHRSQGGAGTDDPVPTCSRGRGLVDARRNAILRRSLVAMKNSRLLLRRWDRGAARQRPIGDHCRRTGLRQVAFDRRNSCPADRYPHTWLEWSCSELLRNTALHPIEEWGRLSLWRRHLASESRLSELESTLARAQARPGGEYPLAGAAI